VSQKLSPVSRAEFVRRLKRLGFDGPFSGGKHEYLIRRNMRLTIPNPHRGDIRPSFLAQILNEAGIRRDEWEGST